MKGYKAFGEGMICLGKQYSENTVFEEDEAKICAKGMHFCKDPLAVLDYYPLVNENGDMSEFAEVEALDEPQTNDNQKYVTKKLKIGAKISFAKLVQASVQFDYEKTANENNGGKTTTDNRDAQIGSSGNSAQIGSSGNSAQIGSSGDWAQIGSSGDLARIGSSGDLARIGSSGNSARIGSSGDLARIGSSGNSAQIGSSGDLARIGSSGNSARIGSSGNSAQIGSSGDLARIGSSGNSARIGSSGNSAQIASSGKNSVICCAGDGCVAKGKIGSWITLAEWGMINGEWTPVCVKTKKIDGVKIKEDTFYQLRKGRFVKVKGEKNE